MFSVVAARGDQQERDRCPARPAAVDLEATGTAPRTPVHSARRRRVDCRVAGRLRGRCAGRCLRERAVPCGCGRGDRGAGSADVPARRACGGVGGAVRRSGRRDLRPGRDGARRRAGLRCRQAPGPVTGPATARTRPCSAAAGAARLGGTTRTASRHLRAVGSGPAVRSDQLRDGGDAGPVRDLHRGHSDRDGADDGPLRRCRSVPAYSDGGVAGHPRRRAAPRGPGGCLAARTLRRGDFRPGSGRSRSP